VETIDEHFVRCLRERDDQLTGQRSAPTEDPRTDPATLRVLLDAQVQSRHLDFAARWLQAQGKGYYTIGSAGHESNAAVALALRVTDPALLHYRSGAFYLARAAQAGRDGVPDVMQGVAAAIDEPIAGGRHKVFGNHELAVIPQTSTISSHLPRAMGVAIAIDRARKLGVECSWPDDAVVVCSFGDASLNHATAQAALNTTAHAAHQHLPVPLLFVCEDNGLGISVPSPSGWVGNALSSRASLRYESADGDDPATALAAARELADWVRETRRPAVLHLCTVRYLGHAGADVEAAYRTPAVVRADLDRDPLLATARWLVAASLRTGAQLTADYLEVRGRVRDVALAAARRPQLDSAAEVMRPLAPRSPAEVAKLARADAAS
jgi:2-oxoisovalerate dehydrogenase E1 component